MTVAGFIFFQIQQKKNKGKNHEKDYSKVDLTTEYIFQPNWKRIRLEWMFIGLAGIIGFIYSFNDSTFETIMDKLFLGLFLIAVLSCIWTIIFLIFNNRKVVFNEDYLETFSFLSKNPTRTDWEKMESVEYLIQNDKIRIQEKKPYEYHSSIGLMHYRTEDQIVIRVLTDAHLSKRGRELQVKYW